MDAELDFNGAGAAMLKDRSAENDRRIPEAVFMQAISREDWS
jgi:hypothetical protein